MQTTLSLSTGGDSQQSLTPLEVGVRAGLIPFTDVRWGGGMQFPSNGDDKDVSPAFKDFAALQLAEMASGIDF